MSRISQIKALATLDAKRNIRSKGILFIIFLLPLLVWGAQIGLLQLQIEEDVSFEDVDIYLSNSDIPIGNASLGAVFVNSLNHTAYSNESVIYGANLHMLEMPNTTSPEDYVLEREYSPLIFIPANFTLLYLSYENSSNPVPKVQLYLLPTDNNLQYDLQAVINSIISNAPFSIYAVDSYVGSRSTIVLQEGEQPPDDISAWMTAFFVLYMALIAPMPIVTSSFARENEQKTLESILASPMGELDILMGKFLGGAILLIVFGLSNIVGMFVYKFILDTMDFYEMVNIMRIQINIGTVIFLFISVYLTTVVALALGISLTSRMSEVRTAETTYNMVMLIPFAIIAIAVLIADPGPSNPLFLLPWPHAIAIIFKGMYPNSFMTDTFTGTYFWDIVVHSMILLLFVVISLTIAAFLTKQGKIFSLGD